MRRSRSRRALLGALLGIPLLMGAGSCGEKVPVVLDAAGLAELVRPTPETPAVLVNLWATW